MTIIVDKQLKPAEPKAESQLVPPVIQKKTSTTPLPLKRIGFFWYNLPWHTGARVHDYQVILALARAGVKVVSITNSIPSFIRDYPSHKNIEWIVNPQIDYVRAGNLDLIIASSGPWVGKALTHSKKQNCPGWIFAYGPQKWFYETMNEVVPDENVLTSRYKQAGAIIVSSELAKGKFVGWIPSVEMKVEVVKPYVNSVHFPKEINKPDVPTITYCGRVGSAEYKGYKDFLRWGGEFRKKFCPNLELNVIANGSIDEKERWPIKFNAFDGISESDKFKVMSQSTAGFVPSKYETFGLVPAEFLALGIPVIAFENEQFQSEYGNDLNYVHSDTEFFKVMNGIIAGKILPIKMKEEKVKELSEKRMDKQIKNMLQRRLPQWKIA